jgi:hypothetical protein
MNHLSDDELLLFAYEEAGGQRPGWGQGPEGEGPDDHLRHCAECRARLAAIDESRVAVDWAFARRRRISPRLAWLALPLAAGIAALFLLAPTRQAQRPAPWHPHVSASPTGYVAGAALMSIDSQLTRLESGRTYDMLRN